MLSNSTKNGTRLEMLLHQKESSHQFFQEYLDGNELSWASGEEVVINGNNFGINMNFTVNCDLTDLIIQQKSLFKPLIQQTLVVSILKDIINSTRDNATANNVRGLVLSNGTIQGYIKTEEDRSISLFIALPTKSDS